MRLDKILEEAGEGSRKEVKRLLVRRQVTVDGVVVTLGARNVDPALQKVCVGTRWIKRPGHHYFLLNKPRGTVSAVSDARLPTVLDCLAADDRHPGLFPVGRLDGDTEGLLLVTDNGKLAYEMLQPKKSTPKTYQVKVNGPLTPDAVLRFKTGIVFHGGTVCQPAKLQILASSHEASEALVTITEGKFHQVKKMFLSVGVKVTELKRLSMGPLRLPADLAPGEYRELTAAELAAIQAFFKS